jgi:hypothetical protein
MESVNQYAILELPLITMATNGLEEGLISLHEVTIHPRLSRVKHAFRDFERFRHISRLLCGTAAFMSFV